MHLLSAFRSQRRQLVLGNVLVSPETINLETFVGKVVRWAVGRNAPRRQTRQKHGSWTSVRYQLLINAPTGQVGSSTNLSSNPTNQDLIRFFLVATVVHASRAPSQDARFHSFHFKISSHL
jgi:hypothetical protein